MTTTPEWDLLNKTELRIERIQLDGADLTEVAAAVAGALGLPAEDVIVIDARDDVLALDVLRSTVDAYRIAGRRAELLSALAGPDPRAPLSLEEPGARFAAPLDRDLTGLRSPGRQTWVGGYRWIPRSPRCWSRQSRSSPSSAAGSSGPAPTWTGPTRCSVRCVPGSSRSATVSCWTATRTGSRRRCATTSPRAAS